MDDDRISEAPTATSIADQIFRDVRAQILRGDLAPGERLKGERELAAQYGTNRNTLREAVRKLEQDKLVTVRHGQGVTVSDFRRTGTLDLLPAFLENTRDLVELARILEDLLPARLQVLEFASRMAVRRADKTDIERLADISDLLISAFHRGDPAVIGRGFQRWLDALIDAGHSVAIRWVANPYLEAYRHLIERYPAVWVLEPSFPTHLTDFLRAMRASDEAGAIEVTRAYYERVDGKVFEAMATAVGGLQQKPAPSEDGVPASSKRVAAGRGSD